MSGVRDRLRFATAEAHAALERDLDLPARLRSRDDLRDALARFLGFFRPLEAALEARLGAGAVRGRDRAAALEADLLALGLSADAIAALPDCAEAGDLPTASDAWGAVYVAEGARLGGRLIARDLAAAGIAHDLRFWSDVAPAAPTWPEVVRALEEVADPALAERGAVRTFERLGGWMAGWAGAARRSSPPDR